MKKALHSYKRASWQLPHYHNGYTTPIHSSCLQRIRSKKNYNFSEEEKGIKKDFGSFF
jgi:hypothetical protein